jgi:hypothetical protein
MVSEAIATGDTNALNYFIAQKYIEALKALASAPNQKVLMLPLDTIGVLGSLAGIAEIAKEALQGPGSAASRGVAPPAATLQPRESSAGASSLGSSSMGASTMGRSSVGASPAPPPEPAPRLPPVPPTRVPQG